MNVIIIQKIKCKLLLIITKNNASKEVTATCCDYITRKRQTLIICGKLYISNTNKLTVEARLNPKLLYVCMCVPIRPNRHG